MHRLTTAILGGLLACGATGCGEDKPASDLGPLPDRAIFEGPVTRKDPDQGPVPDWVLALREVQAPREAQVPLDGGAPAAQ